MTGHHAAHYFVLWLKSPTSTHSTEKLLTWAQPRRERKASLVPNNGLSGYVTVRRAYGDHLTSICHTK